MTSNLRKRFSDHNKGKTKSTKPYRPFTKIIELGSFKTRREARRKEKYYKSGVGREELNRIMR